MTQAGQAQVAKPDSNRVSAANAGPQYIVGAGSTARDALSVLHDRGQMGGFKGFLVDGEPAEGHTVLGFPVLGPRDIERLPRGTRIGDGIASPLREPFIRSLEERGLEFVSMVHPQATVHPFSTIGPGCLIQAGALVSSGSVLEGHVTLNWHALVGHDAHVEEFVHITAMAIAGARSRIGKGAMVGLDTMVLEDRKVGAGSMVGAMSLVTRDIPPGVLAVGRPALVKRPITLEELSGLVAHRAPTLPAKQGDEKA